MSNPNLQLWDAVQTTDPKRTKTFTRSGGFKGTATNATWLAKCATEKFGPCGIGWGVKVLDEQIIEGHPFIENGVVVGHHKVHKVRVQLWYVLGDKRGEIEQFGQTDLVGKNSRGYYTDEEAPKKSITDGMTKCLSLLGFAADIHLGLYDDNKYVDGLKRGDRREDGDEDEPAQRPAPKRDTGPRLPPAEHVKAMAAAVDEAALKRAFALAWKQYENPSDPKVHTEAQLKLKGKYDEFIAELKAKAAAASARPAFDDFSDLDGLPPVEEAQ